MKIVFKIVIAALLVTPLVLASGCGKKNRNNMGGKAAPSGPGAQDFSTLAYNPSPTGQSVLMSDYIFLAPIPGNKDNKRVYAQMSLFFIKDKSAAKPKKHQYQFFYREFVTCQDGPKPNTENKNLSYLAYPIPTGEAILIKGGGLNAVNLGQARMLPGKTKRGATLTLGQKTHGNSPTTVVLNFKETKAFPATLEDYQSIKDPQDADMAKAIAKLGDCSGAGDASSLPTVSYGPPLPVVAPQGGKNTDSAKLIPQDDMFSEQQDNG